MKQVEFDAKCVELSNAQNQKFVSTQQALSELAEKRADEVTDLIKEIQISKKHILEDIAREKSIVRFYATGTEEHRKHAEIIDTCNLRLSELSDFKVLKLREIDKKYAKMKHSISLEYALFKEECQIKKLDLINQMRNNND